METGGHLPPVCVFGHNKYKKRRWRGGERNGEWVRKSDTMQRGIKNSFSPCCHTLSSSRLLQLRRTVGFSPSTSSG